MCNMTNIYTEFTWRTALQAVNILVFQHTGKYLSDKEIIILNGAWNNNTYEQIAVARGYTSSYLCKDIGCKLWEKLSIVLKEKVTKKNFKAALRRKWQNYTQAIMSENQNQIAKLLTTENIDLFRGLIALNSSIYIKSLPIEKICYETILQPGGLIRIEGAKWMGKTSLINHILEQDDLRAQITVHLDFNRVDREITKDLDKLLRWLTVMVSLRLNLQDKVEYYYSRSIVNYDNDCTAYFTKYILSKIENDIVLALDNIDCLFFCQEVAEEFLNLLRDWHEKAKESRHWSKLKLIVTQSTKTNISLDISHSFFELGTVIVLKEFTFEQVKTLANFYELDWNNFTICRLMNEVGGHPYFVRLAMHQAKAQNITLK